MKKSIIIALVFALSLSCVFAQVDFFLGADSYYDFGEKHFKAGPALYYVTSEKPVTAGPIDYYLTGGLGVHFGTVGALEMYTYSGVIAGITKEFSPSVKFHAGVGPALSLDVIVDGDNDSVVSIYRLLLSADAYAKVKLSDTFFMVGGVTADFPIVSAISESIGSADPVTDFLNDYTFKIDCRMGVGIAF